MYGFGKTTTHYKHALYMMKWQKQLPSNCFLVGFRRISVWRRYLGTLGIWRHTADEKGRYFCVQEMWFNRQLFCLPSWSILPNQQFVKDVNLFSSINPSFSKSCNCIEDFFWNNLTMSVQVPLPLPCNHMAQSLYFLIQVQAGNVWSGNRQQKLM